ncbi:MAG: aminotransferase class I/II-fold pyridoxal phosphate-dependent enzyme [Flammeovirgaceae bacterium]|nr:aminotransferase class I/II-fold pyridoxal phosphate-dependent enzyme [Flammeovirgaceae bacterium]
MTKLSKLTLSVHAGSEGDPRFKGTVTPIYPSSAYDYEDMPATVYPRYFNTPNQQAVIEKMVALEGGEDGLVFSSGLAAIMTSLFAFLKSGDHVVFQNDLYGGTYYAVTHEFQRLGINYSMVDGSKPESFEKAIQPETKVIYVETPSNPTLKITDLRAVASIASKHKLLTIIDNTFASPVNQNPISLGIDVVTHSGTKYIGGHSDICCGVMVSSKKFTQQIRATAINFGGSPDPHQCYLIERSLKTLVLRVQQQNKNALALAEYLKRHPKVDRVYYPGLTDHPGHDVAKAQMPGGFGGMLSFEVKGDAHAFMGKLKLIKRALSLGGVESTMCSPVRTSHAKMSADERKKIDVKDNLVRFSVGIEDVEDLKRDIGQALI